MIALDRHEAVLEQAYREAIASSVGQIAQRLDALLTRRLTAYVTNVKDDKTIARWASGDVSNIRQVSEQKLRVAYEIARLILDAGDSEQTVRAWFIGLNPRLDDQSPADVIRAGGLKEALTAARAFVAGSY
jgi:hypothetical protein